jgi:tRNA modification GTPase
MTLFAQGASYTGEASAELSCHGNPLIVERLIQAAVGAGARVADPGEFTRRAMANGRLDATRAEAVLQAIEATSQRGLQVARAGLDGAVATLVSRLRRGLTGAIAELEAWLDYPDDDLALSDEVTLRNELRGLADQARSAADSFRAGRAWVDGARVVLVGPVNAGKSSLFNALGGSIRALVSEVPGTTRDVLERRVDVGGIAVTLMDTAGERESSGLEAEGIALGRTLTAGADLFVVVLPAHDPAQADAVLARTHGLPRILVANHADRVQETPAGQLATVATTGAGLGALRKAIHDNLLGELPGEAAVVIASARQRDLLLAVAKGIGASLDSLAEGAGIAVAAEILYGALERLDALDGRDSREAVLDELFRRFCIGK